jgi:putative tricarboxylic transport membrane protein
MLERAMRQSLQMSLGSPDIFVTRPVSAAILAIAALAMLFPLFTWVRARRNNRALAS